MPVATHLSKAELRFISTCLEKLKKAGGSIGALTEQERDELWRLIDKYLRILDHYSVT